jgi:predicted helicase
MLNGYLKQIAATASRGDATEASYYPVLQDLLETYCISMGVKKFHITPLPKKTEAGNPDFRVWDGKQHITGYIEAKDPSIENLDRIEDTEQLKRYLKTFPNLILTNFLEFRLYRNGEITDRVIIGRPLILNKLKTTPPVEKEPALLKLLEKFFSFAVPKIHDAKTLAVELAKRTRFLKDEVIAQELREEEETSGGFIGGFYEAFKTYLISGLTEEEFADLYAQTITYGLFAARTRSENGFNRKLAYDNIPKTIGILRDVFKFVSLGDLPGQMEWTLDDISEVLAVTDVGRILSQYFHEGKGKDPIIHFYETFLAEYDPKTREMRGVYYTPEPVVSYIVRSLHHIIKVKFGDSNGLGGKDVTVLDPAAGTLTFLAEAAKLVTEEMARTVGEANKKLIIKERILPNYHAFELMMAPYAIGHLKMSFLLEELGYRLQKDDRVKLYLTNTLEMDEIAQTALPGMAALSEESHLAGEIKKEQPILVIMGNPPYSGHSSNTGEWISREIRAYYEVDGKPLNEKNPKWLQDDYVKFIRFAQWKIDQAGEGLLGFITNHSYLDNPTFRGMRRSLMNSFNEIYILDLHGNSLKKEKAPDGSKDENVFDIQQGVAIALFIKDKKKEEKCACFDRPSPQASLAFDKPSQKKKKEKKECVVRHADLWGAREDKYEWLNSNSIRTTEWMALKPKQDFYFFVPRDEELMAEYEKFIKITDVFPVNSVGIVTARDSLTIQWSEQDVWKTVLNFSKLNPETARQAYDLGKDARDWKVELAQQDLIDSGMDKKNIRPILYRPFDIRFTYYTGKSRGFQCMPRNEVMQHMLKENIALITPRRVEMEGGWRHAMISNNIVEHVAVSLKTIDYAFPLYLYPDEKKSKKKQSATTMMIFEDEAEYKSMKANIAAWLLASLKEAYKTEPTPEQIFFYIYAVLYSNIYRTRYVTFLKSDFPRVPFTADYDLFMKMAGFGEQLASLHLMKPESYYVEDFKICGTGNNKIEKPVYDEKNGRIYINADQYIEGLVKYLPPEVWRYQIGGYQVCDKWLKERKGRNLSLEEIQTYCKIVSALQQTIEKQKSIDEIYEELEKEVICTSSEKK